MAVRFDFYEDYCDFLAGGYIDRFDDSKSEEAFKGYQQNYTRFFEENFFRPINICPLFWPRFETYQDYRSEFETLHFLHLSNLKVLKHFVHDDLIHLEDRVGADIFSHAIEEVFPKYTDFLQENH